ncbi:MAG: SufD family Fe-S cluster assembly protein [Bacteroidales bacterium]
MESKNSVLLSPNETKVLFLEDSQRLPLIVNLAENASLHLIVLVTSSIEVEDVFVLQKNSRLNAVYVSLEGERIVQNLRVCIDGEGVNCSISGLVLACDSDICRFSIEMHHRAGGSHSTQVFKQIAAHDSIVEFEGCVIVAQNAQKTNAQQNSKALLLGRNARVNTNPQLEIYADDVKCSHGATVGQLDVDALFYLQTRGIGGEAAKQLLLLGFAEDILDCIDEDVIRTRILRMVHNRIQYLLRV